MPPRKTRRRLSRRASSALMTAPRHIRSSDFELALKDVKVPEHMFAKPKGERKPKERCRDAREWLNQEALHRIEDWAPRFFPCGYVGSQGELARACGRSWSSALRRGSVDSLRGYQRLGDR